MHGYAINGEWKKKTLELLLDPNSTMTSSLYRDMQLGNRVELSIIEDMLKKCKEADLNNSLLEAGYLTLAMYEEKRTSSEKSYTSTQTVEEPFNNKLSLNN